MSDKLESAQTLIWWANPRSRRCCRRHTLNTWPLLYRFRCCSDNIDSSSPTFAGFSPTHFNVLMIIKFSDLVGLWVIKIEKPMILCARSTSRSREQNRKYRESKQRQREVTARISAGTVCLFYSQNNKIVWLSNMGDIVLEKFTRCAKVCGSFSWLCLSDADWLGR